MKTGRVLKTLGAAAMIAMAAAGTASAGVTQVSFKTGDSLENTGVEFTGTLSYDDVSNQLSINLNNTSSIQSVVTGFYFNIAGNASATYNAVNDGSTAGVDEGAFGFDNSLSPFGTWDAGAFLQDLSVQQVKGIDEGETGKFTFNITGADANMLEALDFFTETNSGGGLEGAFAVRYQSVGDNAQFSDKVMGIIDDGPNPPPPPAIPLPPAAWAALVTMGLAGLRKVRLGRA